MRTEDGGGRRRTEEDGGHSQHAGFFPVCTRGGDSGARDGCDESLRAIDST